MIERMPAKPKQKSKRIFIFGIGFVGRHLVKSLKKAGHILYGTSQFQHEGVCCYDLRNPKTHAHILADIQKCDVVVVTVPPVNGKDIVQPILNRRPFRPNQVIYCSSTGLYANSDGQFIDEMGALDLDSKLSNARFNAEQSWFKNYNAVRLRLAGIYGPRRNLITSFLQAPVKLVPSKRDHYFNRIHVEDIAGIIHRIIDKEISQEIYNLADDQPASMYEVLAFVFKEMKLDPKNYIREVAFSDLSPMMQYFYSSNKRIMNNKVKTLLGYKFKYPNYQAGFKNIIAKKQYIL